MSMRIMNLLTLCVQRAFYGAASDKNRFRICVNGSAPHCVDSFGELRVSWWTPRTSKTNNPIATVYSSPLFKAVKV